VVPEDKIEDQDQQQKAANADPASVAVPAVSETTAEQQNSRPNTRRRMSQRPRPVPTVLT
jgi:hypothetical protein